MTGGSRRRLDHLAPGNYVLAIGSQTTPGVAALAVGPVYPWQRQRRQPCRSRIKMRFGLAGGRR